MSDVTPGMKSPSRGRLKRVPRWAWVVAGVVSLVAIAELADTDEAVQTEPSPTTVASALPDATTLSTPQPRREEIARSEQQRTEPATLPPTTAAATTAAPTTAAPTTQPPTIAPPTTLAPTTTTSPTTPATVAVAPPQPLVGETNCEPSYPDVCIPPSPPDLDCGEISERRFRVVGADPHRFDGDNDGIGCESG